MMSNNYNRNYYWQHKKKGGIRKCSINIENNMEILKTGMALINSDIGLKYKNYTGKGRNIRKKTVIFKESLG